MLNYTCIYDIYIYICIYSYIYIYIYDDAPLILGHKVSWKVGLSRWSEISVWGSRPKPNISEFVQKFPFELTHYTCRAYDRCR